MTHCYASSHSCLQRACKIPLTATESIKNLVLGALVCFFFSSLSLLPRFLTQVGYSHVANTPYGEFGSFPQLSQAHMYPLHLGAQGHTFPHCLPRSDLQPLRPHCFPSSSGGLPKMNCVPIVCRLQVTEQEGTAPGGVL